MICKDSLIISPYNREIIITISISIKYKIRYNNIGGEFAI